MKTNGPKSSFDIYQLKVMVLGISPTIWRRILVRSDSTIKDLHYVLQILMGWDDYYLHQFIIRGKKYGISRVHGVWFHDDPDQVFLKDFQFRLNEKFFYEYNFFSEWRIQIRIEKCIQHDYQKNYPFCISGSRQAPYEDCQSPWEFMALRQKYSQWYILNRLIDIIENNEEKNCEEITAFDYWLNVDRFNRKMTNDRLRKYSLGLNHWEMQ